MMVCQACMRQHHHQSIGASLIPGNDNRRNLEAIFHLFTHLLEKKHNTQIIFDPASYLPEIDLSSFIIHEMQLEILFRWGNRSYITKCTTASWKGCGHLIICGFSRSCKRSTLLTISNWILGLPQHVSWLLARCHSKKQAMIETSILSALNSLP